MWDVKWVAGCRGLVFNAEVSDKDTNLEIPSIQKAFKDVHQRIKPKSHQLTQISRSLLGRQGPTVRQAGEKPGNYNILENKGTKSVEDWTLGLAVRQLYPSACRRGSGPSSDS